MPPPPGPPPTQSYFLKATVKESSVVPPAPVLYKKNAVSKSARNAVRRSTIERAPSREMEQGNSSIYYAISVYTLHNY